MASERKFLYVEDDPMSREVMQMILSNGMGVENLVIFEDSANFMERVRALPFTPDVFLLDIHMAPIDGFKMLDLIKQSPDLLNRPVIALTASVMNEEINRLKLEGFDGAIAKPVNIMTLPGLIERVLAGETVWHIS